MIEIKDLLNKWSTILLSEEGKKAAVAQAIGKEIGVDIDTESVKIQNGTVYLNVKPLYKTEIFLKQEKILSRLEEIFGRKSPKDIR